jgi:hypothetical protein
MKSLFIFLFFLSIITAADVDQNIYQVIENRKSRRVYKPDEDVPKETITKIIQAAINAPNAMNY